MTDVTLHPPPAPLQGLLAALDQTRIQHDLLKLCAADFAGRRIGTDGHDRAAHWLQVALGSRGLAVEPFEFNLDLPVLHLAAAPRLAVLDGVEASERVVAHRLEFAEHPASADCRTPITGQVQLWHDDVEIAGAWARLETLPPQETLQALSTQLARRGAVGIVLPQQPTAEGYLSKRVLAAPPAALPIITMRADGIAALEGKSLRAHIPIQRLAASGQLIIGQVDGTDPALADQPLMIGAHYDGVGDDPGGAHLPGAADNAAGVAVILELARVVQCSTVRPRRPISFVAFDGEEVQAQGSLAYASHLRSHGISPLVINLDGAARFNESVWVEASTGAEQLIAALDQAGEWLEIPLILGNVASDNRRYAAAGFPAVGVALGGSGGHTPADTVEYVDSGAMHMAAKLLLAALWKLAF